jgi:putative membrane protein
MDIPVYAVVGFLDAGKTNFINGILEDGFAREDRTLLISCEEGESEYEAKALDNVTVVHVESQEALTCSFLKECAKKYKPKQVIMEYNGMWMLQPLFDILPANWVLYQIMCMVEADTFDMYAKNMGQLMMEKITNADMIIFNRCDEALRDSLRKRNLRMVNRRADIYLENQDGSSENYLTGDECPFDLSQDVLNIADEDYGVWYVDVMDHPDRYAGKAVRMKMIMCHSKKFPGVDCPGRFAMVCCANDITFFGLLAHGKDLDRFKNRDWVEVTAVMGIEEHEAYQGKGPVMNITAIAPCEKPKDEVVSF